MKYPKHFSTFTLFILLLFLSSCGNCHKIKMADNKYMGRVTIRAEKNHTLGLIEILPIQVEKELETPKRAIIYKYEPSQVFDLGKTVYFSIDCTKKLQFAHEIVTTKPDNLVDASTYYKTINGFQLNLHNADIHREGPQHKIWKIRVGTRIIGNELPQNEIGIMVTSIPNDTMHIYFSNTQFPPNITDDLYLSPHQDTTSISIDNKIYHHYNVFTSHEHEH